MCLFARSVPSKAIEERFGVATMTFTNNWDEAEILRRLADAGTSQLDRDLILRV